jgi:hypothetical protein
LKAVFCVPPADAGALSVETFKFTSAALINSVLVLTFESFEFIVIPAENKKPALPETYTPDRYHADTPPQVEGVRSGIVIRHGEAEN